MCAVLRFTVSSNFFKDVFPGGFEIVGVTGANFYPFPPRLARPLARWLPSLAWGFVVGLRKAKSYGGEFLVFVRREGLETNYWLGE